MRPTWLRILGCMLFVAPSWTSPALAAASPVHHARLEFESQWLDLESGEVFDDCDFPFPGSCPGSEDLKFAYHSDRPVHAVLFQNQGTGGRQIAFLNEKLFAAAGFADVATATFTSSLVDQAFESDDTVLLRSDTGAYYKVGGASEDADGVSFTYQKLLPERLYVPAFLVETTAAGGTTTLFAVENLTTSPAPIDVEYFPVEGARQRLDSVTLGPRQTRAVNVRDVGGLAVDADGFARGWIRISGTAKPDGSAVLAGDYFQVDVDDDFAAGERMPRQAELCKRASVRFLNFGQPSKLSILISTPRGPSPASDPASFTVQVFDVSGALLGTQSQWTSRSALTLTSADFTSAAFGLLVFDFTNSGGGFVFAESSAAGRFSVGLGGECEVP